MDIKQEDNGKKGRFYFEIEGKQEAEMIYSYAGQSKIIIEHTEVSEKLKGQGIGYKLVEEVVAFMRKNNLKSIHYVLLQMQFLKKGVKIIRMY
jgi:predicted GNAT family acetyltransferase